MKDIESVRKAREFFYKLPGLKYAYDAYTKAMDLLQELAPYMDFYSQMRKFRRKLFKSILKIVKRKNYVFKPPPTVSLPNQKIPKNLTSRKK